MKHSATILLGAVLLSACGSSVGLTTGPLSPATPGVPTGVNGGGTGTPADPLAGFTTITTFAPTPRAGLEIIRLTGTNTGIEDVPSLNITRTSTGFNFVLSQGTFQYDTRTGSTDITGTNQYTTCSNRCAGSGTGLVRVPITFNSGAASTLSYATYGAWTRTSGPITLEGFGVFATGIPTTSANVPITGAATYSGTATGFVDTGTATTHVAFNGTATLSTDFAARTISGTISNITTTNVSTPATTGTLSNIVLGSGTYNAAGTGFSGSAAALSSTNDVFDLSGATGQFAGAFYGPNAAEAAGSFSLSKTGARVIGAFGAKR